MLFLSVDVSERVLNLNLKSEGKMLLQPPHMRKYHLVYFLQLMFKHFKLILINISCNAFVAYAYMVQCNMYSDVLQI